MSDKKYLTEDEIAITLGVANAMSILSVTGSVFIIACYLRFTHLRKFAFKLVAMLSFTDVLNQIGDFVSPSVANLERMQRGDVPISPSCWFQALSDSFFEISSVLWTTAIAATLYMFVFLRMPGEEIERKFKYMCLVAYGIPLVLTLLPLADDAYGVTGAWCWIKDDKEAWRFAQFYVPLWIAVIFNAVVYARALRLLRGMVRASASAGMLSLNGDGSGGGSGGVGGGSTDETVAKLNLILRRLQLYPFILIIVWLFASINRIYEAATGGQQVFALYFLQKVFSSMQGLLNALAYGFSGGVREAIRDQLAACFPRCFKDKSMGALGGAAASAAGGADGGSSVRKSLVGGGSSGGDKSNRALAPAHGIDDEEDADVDDLTVSIPPQNLTGLPLMGIAAAASGGGGAGGAAPGSATVAVAPGIAALGAARAAAAGGSGANANAATVVRNPVAAAHAAAAAAAAAAAPAPGTPELSRQDRVKRAASGIPRQAGTPGQAADTTPEWGS